MTERNLLLSLPEGRALMQVHTQHLYTWASKAPDVMNDKIRLALLETAARLYQIIADLPTTVKAKEPKLHS